MPAWRRCGFGGVDGFVDGNEYDDLKLKLCDDKSMGLLLRRKSPVKLDEGEEDDDDVVLVPPPLSGDAAERLRPETGLESCFRTGLGL